MLSRPAESGSPSRKQDHLTSAVDRERGRKRRRQLQARLYTRSAETTEGAGRQGGFLPQLHNLKRICPRLFFQPPLSSVRHVVRALSIDMADVNAATTRNNGELTPQTTKQKKVRLACQRCRDRRIKVEICYCTLRCITMLIS